MNSRPPATVPDTSPNYRPAISLLQSLLPIRIRIRLDKDKDQQPDLESIKGPSRQSIAVLIRFTQELTCSHPLPLR